MYYTQVTRFDDLTKKKKKNRKTKIEEKLNGNIERQVDRAWGAIAAREIRETIIYRQAGYNGVRCATILTVEPARRPESQFHDPKTPVFSILRTHIRAGIFHLPVARLFRALLETHAPLLE